MDRPYIKDIEGFIAEFIKSVNGNLVTDIAGVNPAFNNADFIFKEKNVVLELKCLEKDMFTNEDDERNGIMIDKWIQKGWLRKEDIIPVFVQKNQLPEDCLQDLFQACRKSFQRILEKANKQLKETSDKIGNAETLRVAIICNDGNYLFPNNLLMGLLSGIMLDRSQLEIDCILYITINQNSLLPGSDKEWRLWVPMYSEDPKDLPAFINQLGLDFNVFYNTIFSIENNEHKTIESVVEMDALLKGAKFIPKNVAFPDRSVQ